MVAPSAWASHILVASKSEAVQLRQNITKLKDTVESECDAEQKLRSLVLLSISDPPILFPKLAWQHL